MGKNARDNRPHLKKVQRIELSEKNLKLRVFLFVVFLVIGAALIVYGLSGFFTTQTGWREITVDASGENCGNEFYFQYEIGASDISAKTEYNQVKSVYGMITAEAYKLFHETELFDGVYNLAYINAHPNETVEVDEVLYNAISKLESAGTRQPYIAPIYEFYAALFTCSEDSETMWYDPTVSEDVADLFSEILSFTNDPDAVSLELKEAGKVRLHVSDEYLAFAENNNIGVFYGFHWMKNAFIVDYLAERLIENGFTHGAVSSYNGFCRSLDSRGTSYSLNLFDRVDNTIVPGGQINYTVPLSTVALRTFPVSYTDDPYYYVLENGETRFPYISTQSGLCLAAQSNFVCFSEKDGCADVLLNMIPVYVSDSLDVTALKYTGVFCQDDVIWYTSPLTDDVTVTPSEDNGYMVEPFNDN